jgi:hypothetical protein
MAYPQPKVFVPAQRDEDCRGGWILVWMLACVSTWGVVLVLGMLLYEWLTR